MTLNHANATAIVTLDGLAVCCFNKRNHQWQVAFLRQPHHKLMLTVTTSTAVIVPPTIVSSASSIKIYTVKGVTPDYQNAFKGGFFDNGVVERKGTPITTAEKENFRWVVDLEDSNDLQHGYVQLKRPPYPVTLTTISDAVFYNDRVTEGTPHHFFILPEGIDANSLEPVQLGSYEFGKVDDEISGDIMCEEGGSVVIEIDGKTIATLEAMPGITYRISLLNMMEDHLDPDPSSAIFEKVDFSLYYDVIDVTQGKIAMWGIPPHSHTRRVSCNVVRMSITDDLSPLVS